METGGAHANVVDVEELVRRDFAPGDVDSIDVLEEALGCCPTWGGLLGPSTVGEGAAERTGCVVGRLLVRRDDQG